MFHTRLWFACLSLAGLSVLSCLQPQTPQATVDQAGHWIHSQQLQQLMAEVGASTNENWPGPFDGCEASMRAEDWEAALDQACILGHDLHDAAVRIPDLVASAEMPDGVRRAFIDQALKLSSQGLILEEAGMAGDVDGMQEAMVQINVSCVVCHQRYRDFAGPFASR